MKNKAILYSLNDGITIGKLKKMEDDIDISEDKQNKIINYCYANNIWSLVWDEIDLKKTKRPSYILYYIWDYHNIINKKIIGIVWPRKINDFIKSKIEDFFERISFYKDIVIVSWLAEWTDFLAHNLALSYNIPTIWVLWFWIQNVLKSNKRHIINKIKEQNWLIISEFPLNQSWTKRSFPQRNRIIAWISDVLFVPQAKQGSWSLITVNDALDINVPVYSCISSMDDKTWSWTNKLISEKKVNWIYDMDLFVENIVSSLNLEKQQNTENNFKLDLWDDELLIINSIKKENFTLEMVCEDTKLDYSNVLKIISMLELKWVLKIEQEKLFLK